MLIRLTDKTYLRYRFAPGDTVEIVDIAVDSEYRRRGLGRLLIGLLFCRVSVQGAKLIYAITRESNKIAQEFYKALGFQLLGELKAFYVHGKTCTENALVFGYRLGEK